MKKMIKKNKKGFTLIELIVVIAILAILALILIPSISNYVNEANESKNVANARSLLSEVNADVAMKQVVDATGATASNTITVTVSKPSGADALTYNLPEGITNVDITVLNGEVTVFTVTTKTGSTYNLSGGQLIKS